MDAQEAKDKTAYAKQQMLRAAEIRALNEMAYARRQEDRQRDRAEAAEAELVKLRSALGRIFNMPRVVNEARKIAREALGETVPDK